MPLTKCEQCGKLKEVSKSRLARNKHNFCSTTCRNKWMSLNLVGENHLHFGKKRSQSTKDNISKANKNPQWKGGISFGEYCPKFNDEFKERVRKFFNYTCQMCGHVWRSGEKRLCVHHINYDKTACCDKNVKPLFTVVCPGNCHNQTNKNREYWYQHFQELIAIQYGGRCYLPK
jgi:hypothetical protein